MPDEIPLTAQILDIAFDAFVAVDLQGRIADWSSKAEAIFGWSRAEAIGQPAHFVVPERHHGAYDSGLRGLLSADRALGANPPVITTCVRRDGTEFPVEVASALTPAGLISFVRDLSGQRRLEEALREAEERRGILNSLEDGYTEVDLKGNYQFVNDAYCRMFHRTREEVLSTSYKQYFEPEAAARFKKIFRTVYETGQPVKAAELEYKPGRFIEVSVSLRRNAAGKAIGFLTLTRETTERWLRERELAAAKESAEAASRAKSDFLANMSHEIRTPMNGVIGMTGVLLDTELTEDQRECAEMVRNSGEVLLTVINDILDFSKIEAGKLDIEAFPFDLRLVVEEVTEMVAPKAEEKRVDLAVQYPSNVPRRFIGDGGRIRQVVTNLVANAVKFTHDGHILITIAAIEVEDERAVLRIEVRDTGIGIPPDRLGCLFEKFSQADSSTTRRYGGTGLGLAIAKQLVELMGGQIGVESEVGKGSTFWCTVPLPLDSQPCSAPLPVADLSGLRVLVVDDNAINRRIVNEQIAGWGMRGGSDVSSEQAMEALREAQANGDPYHFVITDYHMPGIDGAALATMVKADPAIHDVVFVMLTSIGQRSEVKNLASASIDVCLVKPVRQSQLWNALAESWAKKLGRDSTGAAQGNYVNSIKALQSRLSRELGDRLLRVLVVEDNIVNQTVTARMLERLGVRSDVAANGREALDMLGIAPYDVVLMDCQMPVMDGYEAAAEIRRRQGPDRQIVIIAMTADAAAGSQERCIRAGMDDYITKPVNITSLTDSLAKWSEKSARYSSPV
jgi:PAS domain S-box-containing protein